jgi:adenylate cyclase
MPGRQLCRHIVGGRYEFRELVDHDRQALFRMLGALLLVISISLGLALGSAQLLARPIRDLTEAVGLVREGRFDTHLDLPDRNEFGQLADSFNVMVRGLREGNVLGRFVSDQVRAAVRAGDMAQLAGETRQIDVTVLFVGLTGLDAGQAVHGPEKVAHLLTILLSDVSKIVSPLRGEIDKMIGEQVLVVFDHRRFASSPTAVQAAIDAAKRLETALGADLNPFPGVSPAIGISTGKVLSGILGAPSVRLDFTVIGDTVNLGARLLALASQPDTAGILIDGETHRLAPFQAGIERLAIDRVKGKTRSIEVFRVPASSRTL